MRTLVPGLVVAGKYQLLRVLGEGGMGAVFEVEHLVTHKRAALKWLHPELGAHESGHARLLQEARATSRIRHRHVIDLYDVVEEEEGALCLVMELLSGELLSQWLTGGERTLGELLALLLPAMEGVAAAHAAGVVHRDIKPSNILLARSAGEVVPKVIDFGISRTFDGERLTGSGMAMGTPRYVSFEQLRGERDVDGRSDVYAFGVILYEALVGRAPHEAKTFAEQAVRFATMPPPLPRALRPELHPDLEAVALRAIARDRAERYPDMPALIAALTPFAAPSHPCASLRLWRVRAQPEAGPTLRSPRSRGSQGAGAVAAQKRTSAWRWAVPGVLLLTAGMLVQAVRVHGAPSQKSAPGARALAAPRVPLPRRAPQEVAAAEPLASTPRSSAAVDASAPAVAAQPVDAALAEPPGAHALRPRPRQRGRASSPAVDGRAAQVPLDVATPTSRSLRAGQLRRHEF